MACLSCGTWDLRSARHVQRAEQQGTLVHEMFGGHCNRPGDSPLGASAGYVLKTHWGGTHDKFGAVY
jgi:hypothetical protein